MAESESDIFKQIAIVRDAASLELEAEQAEKFEKDERSLREQYLQGVVDTTSYLLNHGKVGVTLIDTIVERGRSRYEESRQIINKYPALGE